MARSVREWIGKTDDTAVPPRVQLRVWNREEGKCHRCRRKIPADDAWIIEHRQAIILGGANAEPNLCLSCSWCKPAKDAEDAAAKSKIASTRAKHLGIRPPSRIRSAGWGKAAPQKTASTPLTKRVGYFEDLP